MFASWQGNVSTVKSLIKHMAVIDDQDKVHFFTVSISCSTCMVLIESKMSHYLAVFSDPNFLYFGVHN